ncbi:MAG TPA: serine/threonine-protein kinase [Polyangia bacterium]
MQQTVKERIGRYEVICPLGEGGMAQVYLGLSRGPADVNKLVVMKLIRSELARDKRFVTMFLDEARLATRLNHPNVVHTYEVLDDAGKYVLTMEYLEGQSLFDIFQRIDLQYFPLDVHLWILTQVLAGLQYAHALPDYNGSPLGVVHRDVSPDNTFVTYSGEVKLLDFGIAKAAGAVSVTNRGTFKGKLAYCAPEQLQGEDPPDARADIFAAGVMLWEALAGKRIEAGDTCARLAQTRLSGREPRIRAMRPDVAPALAEMCDRAMALSPADRYLSAVDFQRDLERYLEKDGKRVGRAQLAELMQGHFENERRSMRKRVQDHLLTARKAPVATRQSPSYGLGPSRGSRHRVTAPGGSGPAIFHSQTVKTQAASSPPAIWAPKSVLPEPAAPALPPTHAAVPAGQSRFLTKRVIVLAAVLIGSSAAGIGSWKRLSKAAANATGFRKAPSSIALPAKPSESPQLTPATIPVPPAASPETVRPDIQVAHALAPGLDGHLKAERLLFRSSVRVGKKTHPAQNLRKSHSNAKPGPEPHHASPQRTQIVGPGMDLERPSIGGTGKTIDERNPYGP